MTPFTAAARVAATGLCALLVACGGGYEGTPAGTTDSSTQALAVAGAATLTLVPTEMTRLTISGGSRPYSATSQNPQVALASVSDNLLSVAAVQGSTSPVTITVTDAKGARASVAVTVTNAPAQGSFSLSAREVSLQPGALRSVTITGGTPPFTAVSLQPLVVAVGVNGSVVELGGQGEGVDAEVRIVDAKGVTQVLRVTVAAPAPVASALPLSSNMPTNLAMRPRRSQTFTLIGGTPPYTASSSNPASVVPTVRGAALVLQPAAAGQAVLSVTDHLGQTLTQPVTVAASVAPLALSASALTGAVGSTLDVVISGGLPPYRALTTATPAVAQAGTIDGNLLRLNLLNVGGPWTVSVMDAESNTASVSVTATAVLSTLSVSPAQITLSERLARDASGQAVETVVPLRLVRGVAPYQVFTTHPNLLRPTVVGDVVRVSPPGSTADSPIAPCVDQTTAVVVTVIDATGAAAASTLTVLDNGSCPN